MALEHGFGAINPGLDERDFVVDTAVLEELASASVLPDSYRVPTRPPLTDQRLTPECVSYSSAYEQNEQDQREHGRFFDFDEHRFHGLIGGTTAGANTRNALERMLNFGYPEQDRTASPEKHQIAAYYQVPLNALGLKQAIYAFGGVLMVGLWFDSWVHPLGDEAVLPSPSGTSNGHQWWAIGWDSYGLIGQNSWGSQWGDRGLFRIPWSFLEHMWSAWKTVDEKTLTRVFRRARIRRIDVKIRSRGVLGDDGHLKGTWVATTEKRGIVKRGGGVIAEPWDKAFKLHGFRRGVRHGVGHRPRIWGVIEIASERWCVPAPQLRLV